MELSAFVSRLFAPNCLDRLFRSIPLVSGRSWRNRSLLKAPVDTYIDCCCVQELVLSGGAGNQTYN